MLTIDWERVRSISWIFEKRKENLYAVLVAYTIFLCSSSMIFYPLQVISDSIMISLLASLRRLRAFALCYCLGDLSISSFKLSVPNLRKLKLERVTPWMTNYDLVTLTQNCANLVELSLLGCTRLNSGVQFSFVKCSNLTCHLLIVCVFKCSQFFFPVLLGELLIYFEDWPAVNRFVYWWFLSLAVLSMVYLSCLAVCGYLSGGSWKIANCEN